jgi:type I restriction enzyme M protein
VSLPAGIFQPYSGVKTSILLIDKTLAKKTDKVLFVKVDNDGFALGAQRKELSTSDLPEAANLIRQYVTAVRNDDYSTFDFSNLPLNSLVVEKTKIAENDDYNLSVDRYRVDVANQTTKFDLVTLGDVCSFVGGYAFKSSDLTDEQLAGQLPVIKIGNLDKEGHIDISSVQYSNYDDSLKKYRIIKDDILMAMTGATVGKVAISDRDKLLLNQRVGLIRANEELINKEFLKMLLLSERFYEYCQLTAGGGAQGNISPTEIMNFKFPLPPLSYQESVSDKIVRQNKIILGARQIIENYKPEIDMNPDWIISELGMVCDFSQGIQVDLDLQSKEYIEGYDKFLRIENYTQNSNDLRYIPKELGKNKYVNSDEVVVVRYGASAGFVGRGFDGILANNLFKVTPNEKITNDFLYYFLSSDNIQAYFKRITAGGAMPALSFKTVEVIPIPIPTIEEQNQIVLRIENEQTLVGSNKEIIQLYENKIKNEINKLWSE